MPNPIHHLILVRHAQPEITLGVAARDWRLSEEGRRRCQPLAEEIARRYAPVVVVSSDEPKAIETADLIAEPLGVSIEIAYDLREHDRDEGKLLDDAAFQATVTAFFARPAELLFGKETAVSALFRFWNGIADVLAAHPAGDIVVVTHGRVMSLYLAAVTGVDPYPLWQSLRLPDARVIARPDATDGGGR
jgi:broad specificity phosphatase PhoE